MDGEIVTNVAVSSTKEVVCGVSVIGGLHVCANCLHWRVLIDSMS